MATLLLVLVEFVRIELLSVGIEKLRTRISRRRNAIIEREKLQKQQEEEQREREHAEAMTPELEKQRKAEERRQKREADRQQAEQTRREHVRFETRLLMDRYRAELGDMIPHDEFEKYFEHDLADSKSAEQVEFRGQQLQQMIMDRLNLREKSANDDPQSIDDIVRSYCEKREKLQALNIDAEALDALLYEIDQLEIMAIREFIE